MTFAGLSVGEWLAVLGLLAAIGAGYVRLQIQVVANALAAADALRVAREARDEVHNVRLEVAEKYASVAHLKEVEARLAIAIDRLTDRIDKLLSAVTKVN